MIQRINVQDLKITLKNKATIRLFGSNKQNKMRGPYLTRYYKDEAAFHKNPANIMTKIIRPMLDRVRPYGGGLIASTPNGKDYFYELRNKGREGQKGRGLLF
jgi:hypothetical protein